MKRWHELNLSFLGLALIISCTPGDRDIISEGLQPQIATDTKGNIRVVYGSGDRIFCSTSKDKGITFGEPILVGEVEDLGLGASRGPQIASSADYTVVTAIDKGGDIYSFQLDHSRGTWVKAGKVNDVEQIALEGLMSLAADDQNKFYAVWLDLRDDKSNKIFFSTTSDGGSQWARNSLIYKSPDGTVCECCKPGIAVKNSKIAIMFRNYLQGARDLYVSQSDNRGISFLSPQKLGSGTWLLKGCPMDGGGVVISSDNEINTAWQRDGIIYYCQPGQDEIQVAKGRACSISGITNPIIAWQAGSKIKVKYLSDAEEIIVGEGNFIETLELQDKKILCVWERDGKILFKRI